MFRSMKPLVLLPKDFLSTRSLHYSPHAQKKPFYVTIGMIRHKSSGRTPDVVERVNLQTKFIEEWDRKHYDKRLMRVVTGDEYYEGEMLNNVRHGFGKLIGDNRKTGMVYVGNWVNGKPEGYGHARLNNGGGEYEGGWKQGLYHGQGKVVFNAGGSYIGDWVDGQKHGVGIDVSQEGAVYEGEFRNHKKHGRGTLRLPSGTVYVGDFVEGRMEGSGTLSTSDGTVYVGEYLNNQQHGKGSVTYAKGGSFVGIFRNGRRDGQGVATSHKGDVSEGVFLGNSLHGPGVLKLANGKVVKGNFVDGQLEKINAKYVKNGKDGRTGKIISEESKAAPLFNPNTQSCTTKTRSKPNFKFKPHISARLEDEEDEPPKRPQWLA